MNERIAQILIIRSATIIMAIKQMDMIKRKLLIVIDDGGKFSGLLSIGDIQRALIGNLSTSTRIDRILRADIKISYVGFDKSALKKEMLANRREFEPVIDVENNIVDVIFWEDLQKSNQLGSTSNLGLPVVIMAGGEGTRLKPLTNVLPKPLIPLAEQTILEDIMEKFVECGCDQFYLSVNYKAEFIKLYFESVSKKNFSIDFFQEEKPLGTAGSLHLLADKIQSAFFVSNCDIIIDEDYANIYEYHKKNHNEITIVAAIKSLSIPYGTLETKEDGILEQITEKPTFVFKINTGLYLLEPHLLDEIPKNEFYHITFLIEKLITKNRKVGVFPISEGSWTDIGNWEEYIRYINRNE